MKNNQSDNTPKMGFTYSDADIASRIRTLRIKNHYTQESLAVKLGLERSYIGHVECGDRSCSKEVLANLALLFDVSLDYLIFGTDRSAIRIRKELRTIIDELGALRDSL